jgi:hypothetical protein
VFSRFLTIGAYSFYDQKKKRQTLRSGEPGDYYLGYEIYLMEKIK